MSRIGQYWKRLIAATESVADVWVWLPILALLLVPFTGPTFLYRYKANLPWLWAILAGIATGFAFFGLILGAVVVIRSARR